MLMSESMREMNGIVDRESLQKLQQPGGVLSTIMRGLVIIADLHHPKLVDFVGVVYDEVFDVPVPMFRLFELERQFLETELYPDGRDGALQALDGDTVAVHDGRAPQYPQTPLLPSMVS